MPRTKGGISKIRKKPVSKSIYREIIGDDDLDFIESKIFKEPISQSAKKKIAGFSNLYAAASSIQTDAEAIPVKKAIKVLKSWIKVSCRTQAKLKGATSQVRASKAAVNRRLRKLGDARRTRLWLHQFGEILELGIIAAAAALEEMPGQAFAPGLKGDLWLAWVRLLQLTLEETGTKVSIPSSENADTSKFVSMIYFIQKKFPPSVRRRSTPQSIAKGLVIAKREMIAFDAVTLMALLGMFGLGKLTDYDRNTLDDRIAKLIPQQRTQNSKNEQ
jgi:hypothetical protein